MHFENTLNAENCMNIPVIMTKCSKLWTNVSKSTKATDTVEAITKLSLRAPGETRWNATYDTIN